jgi:toxin CptA
MKSVPVVAFDYRPSRLLTGALAVAFLLSMFALALSGMALAAKLLCGILAMVYAPLAMRRLFRASPCRAAWQAAGHWRLAFAEGPETVAELCGSAIRGSWIVLNLRVNDGRRVDLILAPDNSDVETRRLLRVRLSRNADISRA